MAVVDTVLGADASLCVYTYSCVSAQLFLMEGIR
jgi:hypothetical protein